MNKTSTARKLTESAVLLAIATVLSFVKIADLPYGGSVTIASMLPIVLISYRYGIRWGLLSGLAYAALQQLFGLNTLSYATSAQAMIAIILLDYIIAFTVAGLGGVFRKKLSQPQALVLGGLLVCLLRFICHVISGATVWAGLSIPDEAALLYSLGYNATYMAPETIILMVVAYYLGSVLDFGSENLRPYRAANSQNSKLPVTKWVGGIVIVAAACFDTVMIFSKLQNAETGEFDITGLASVSWIWVAVISACAAVAGAVLLTVSARKNTAAA